MPDYADLLIERHGDVALVKLNRPEKLNSMGGTLMSDLFRYCNSLNSGDYETRAVVLTGEGRAFCAGGDVTGFPSANPNSPRATAAWRRPHPEQSTITAMRNCDVPIIGAINGYAVGGGFGLALATDFRICSEDAVFECSQLKRGLALDVGLPFLLQETVGTQRALELAATRRGITADEALALGVVLEVVPNNRLIDRALELAQQAAAGPPLGFAATKRLVYLPEADALQRVEESTGAYISQLFKTEDAREGAKSFVERREPKFRGR